MYVADLVGLPLSASILKPSRRPLTIYFAYRRSGCRARMDTHASTLRDVARLGSAADTVCCPMQQSTASRSSVQRV